MKRSIVFASRVFHNRISCNSSRQLLPDNRKFRYDAVRPFSQFKGGQDLLADSLAFGERRKIILDAYFPSGIDVVGMIEYPNSEGKDIEDERPDSLHMNGSILAFPHACFLWKVSKPKDVTLESLTMVLLFKPSSEVLFIGSNKPLPPREFNRIQKEFKKKSIVVEQMDVTTAMGTFNILNGEDRRVAVAILVDGDED